MKKLVIEATRSSPKIVGDPDADLLEITGESYHENTMEFYAPVFSWLEKYIAQIEIRKATVNLNLVYFNSSSSKVLMDMFDMLDDAARAGGDVTVNWLYDEEDEDSLEFGEEFMEDLEYLKFNLLKKNQARPS
ncbi:MAG: DUF1987 domain-containing protein [Desulfobacterales bacterium]|nr:DUF1987 domain-containing protein [Desulfobacterales bacterium]